MCLPGRNLCATANEGDPLQRITRDRERHGELRSLLDSLLDVASGALPPWSCRPGVAALGLPPRNAALCSPRTPGMTLADLQGSRLCSAVTFARTSCENPEAAHEPLARFGTRHRSNLSSARRSTARCTTVTPAIAWGTGATRETLEASSPRTARCLWTIVYALRLETLSCWLAPLTRNSPGLSSSRRRPGAVRRLHSVALESLRGRQPPDYRQPRV